MSEKILIHKQNDILIRKFINTYKEIAEILKVPVNKLTGFIHHRLKLFFFALIDFRRQDT